MHFVICKYYQGLGGSRALRALVVEASSSSSSSCLRLICISLPSRVLKHTSRLLYLHFAHAERRSERDRSSKPVTEFAFFSSSSRVIFHRFGQRGRDRDATIECIVNLAALIYFRCTLR